MSSKHFETFFSSKHTPSKNQHMEPTKSPVWKKEHDLPKPPGNYVPAANLQDCFCLTLPRDPGSPTCENEFLLGLGTPNKNSDLRQGARYFHRENGPSFTHLLNTKHQPVLCLTKISGHFGHPTLPPTKNNFCLDEVVLELQ